MRGDRVLFTGLDVRLSGGEAVLLRGPNGAGKTTLLRVLAGLVPADAGAAIRNTPLHWVGHSDGLKPHESPRAHLSLWAKAWGGDGVEAAINRLGLARAADVPAKGLSAGQRRRTALARLLLEARPVWLLDEPFAALDTAGADIAAELLEFHRAGGGAVCAAVHGDVPVPDARDIAL